MNQPHPIVETIRRYEEENQRIQAMKLTTEQKNILIAEYCGLSSYLECSQHGEITPDRVVESPKGNKYCPWCRNDLRQREIPSYFTDLNACAEVESKLSTSGPISQRDNYDCRLLKICGTHSAAISATAAQRAEAIGLTLNLWKAGE